MSKLVEVPEIVTVFVELFNDDIMVLKHVRSTSYDRYEKTLEVVRENYNRNIYEGVRGIFKTEIEKYTVISIEED